MSAQAWLTLAVVAGVVYVLAKSLASPPTAMLGGVIALLLAGVISPAQAFAGFANAAPVTVAALYVLAHAVRKTGALTPVVRYVLGTEGGRRARLARLCLPVAGASAFLNNTPIVAMAAPEVAAWAERRGEPPSRYLMPLSFATILGGMTTLIGTSTNLLVSGLLEASGRRPLGLFELTPVGLPVALVGLLVVVLLAPLVLPDRRSARAALTERTQEFAMAMVVERGGPLDGMSVEAAKLRHLEGVFLVEAARGGEVTAPVAPTFVLAGGDRLTFVGRADQVVDLQARRGLVSAERPHMEALDTPRHTFVQAVVGAGSPVAGRTLREVGFRGCYQAAVVAIHRAGVAVRAKFGAVKLHAGDSLILLTDPDFVERWQGRDDFLLVAPLGGTPPAVARRAWIAALVGLGVVAAAGAGVVPLLQASLAGAGLLVAFRVLTPREARDAVDLNVVVTIAAAFGLGAAITRSGLAEAGAGALIGGVGRFGVPALVTAVVVATVLLNEAITNNATAALLFPVVLAAAARLGVDPRPLVVALAVAASASFLTPVGYQTNTMVYGLGGYRFGDYARLGGVVTLFGGAALVAAVVLAVR